MNSVSPSAKPLLDAHSVIRDTSGTGETNYGNMSLCSIDGIQFVTSFDNVKYLPGVTIVPSEEIPTFVAHIALETDVSVYKKVSVYSLKKEDLRPLAASLSRGRRLVACGAARNYATWNDGVLTDGPRPLSSFYTNITPNEEESFRF